MGGVGLQQLDKGGRWPVPYRRAPAPDVSEGAAQKRKSDAMIMRQVTELSAQARQWRAMATELRVNAALIGIPVIQFSMFKIAQSYEDMACAAERHCGAYLKRRFCLALADGVSPSLYSPFPKTPRPANSPVSQPARLWRRPKRS